MKSFLRFPGLVFCTVCCFVNAGQFRGWRGDGTGHYADAQPPLKWGEEQNVAWKTRLPTWSNASPVVTGDRVFVCAEPDTLLCVDKRTGDILWQHANSYVDIAPEGEKEAARQKMEQARGIQKKIRRVRHEIRKVNKKIKQTKKQAKKGDGETEGASLEDLEAQKSELGKQKRALENELKPVSDYALPNTHGANGYSSSTPVTDGENVYVLFGTGVVACYDVEGQRKWARVLEKPKHGWGHSASPLLAGGHLIVHILGLTALDPDTGATVWQAGARSRWGSPVCARIGGRDVIVTANGDLVRADDGTVIARKLSPLTYCAPVIHDSVAYFIQHGGRAVRLPETADGKTEPEVLWKTTPKKERYYASPIVREGLIYCIMQKHVFSVIDAATGEVVHSRKLPLRGTAYPSITLAGDVLFVGSESGKTLFLKPGRQAEQVAAVDFEKYRTTPVFQGKRMYLRTMRHLYCIERAE